MRGPVFALFAGALGLGCASSGAARRSGAAVDWPLGNDARQRVTHGVEFGPPGRVRFSSITPAYLVFLELRPTLDSLDVRQPLGDAALGALIGPVDLVAPSETVDRLTPMTASAPAGSCTIMKNAGGEVGEFCPVSRSYERTPQRSWYFRNRVFLLVTSTPLPTPLPQAIPWAGQRTMPPVSAGSTWTVLTL